MKGNDKFSWEWSSKHTRLRFQLIASATLFLAFCRFTIEAGSFKLPLSVIEFKNEPSSLEFILYSALFYLFSLTSFIVRSSNERNALDISSEKFFELGREVEKKLDALSNFSAQIGARNFDILSEKFRNLALELKTLSKKITVGDKSFEKPLSMLADVKTDIERSMNLVFEYERLQDIYKNPPAMAGPSTPSAPPEPVNVEGMKLLEWMDVVEHCYRELSRINEKATIPRIVSSESIASIETAITDMAKTSSSENIRVEELMHYFRQEGPLAFRSLKKEIGKLNRKSERRLKYNKFDREILGYWLPVLTSFVVIIFGLSFLAGIQ